VRRRRIRTRDLGRVDRSTRAPVLRTAALTLNRHLRKRIIKVANARGLLLRGISAATVFKSKMGPERLVRQAEGSALAGRRFPTLDFRHPSPRFDAPRRRQDGRVDGSNVFSILKPNLRRLSIHRSQLGVRRKSV